MRLAAFFQILLMVFFRSPEFWGRLNRGDDWFRETSTVLKTFLGRLRSRFLFRRMVKHDRSILRSHIGTLAIQRSRVVVGPENLQQLFVTDFGGIKVDINHLDVSGPI